MVHMGKSGPVLGDAANSLVVVLKLGRGYKIVYIEINLKRGRTMELTQHLDLRGCYLVLERSACRNPSHFI